jgi:hypothetical protein
MPDIIVSPDISIVDPVCSPEGGKFRRLTLFVQVQSVLGVHLNFIGLPIDIT